MRDRWKFTLIVAVAAIVFTLPADARRGGGRSIDHPLLSMQWNHVEKIADKIGMTDKQLDELKTLRHDYRHSQEPLKSQLNLLQNDLRDILASGNSSTQTQANQLAKSINELHSQITLQKIDSHYKLIGILSDSQRDTLKNEFRELRNERSGTKGKRTGQRGDRPGRAGDR